MATERLGAIANYYGPVDLARWEVAPLAQFIWQKRFHESMEDAMLDGKAAAEQILQRSLA